MGSTLLAFMVMVGVLMVALGGVLSPDLVLVFAGLIAIVALSGRPGLRGLLPLPLIALAWEAMRGLSAGATGRVHSTDVVGFERAVSGGVVPTEVLQRAFHTAGSINPLDIAMTVVYVGHFAVPVVVGYLIWRRSRGTYYRYAMAMVIVALVGYATQILVPVAPPRLAGLYGPPLQVADIARQVLDGANFLPIAAWGYGNLSGNQVAAWPSLHAAFPLLGAIYLAKVRPREGAAMAIYSVVVWFSVVYLGQHYVVDVIGGVVYALAVWVMVRSVAFERFLEWLVGGRVLSPAPVP